MSSTPPTTAQLEELLADACARADEVCHAADPPRKMRELLAPLHAFVTQQIQTTVGAASPTAVTSQGGSGDVATTSKYNAEVQADSTAPTPSPAKSKTPALLVDAVTRIQSFVAPSSVSSSSTGTRTAAARSDASSNSNSSNSNADNKSTAADAQRGNKPPTGLFSGAVNRFQAFVRGSNSGSHSTHESTIVLSPKRAPISNHSDAATRIQALVRGTTERVSFTKQQSFLLQGTKVLKKYVLKSDRFPNCHVLGTPDGDIAPNFRRLGDSMLYGSAQPSLEGIQMILKRVAADGFSQVVWINLREEPVLYANGQSFTARRIAKLNENDIVPGITGHKVAVLETSMANSLREQLNKTQSHMFEYWHEHALHENELVKTTVDPTSGVATVPELFASDAVRQADPKITSVAYHRLPIARENAPEHADVERIMALIHAATPIVADATHATAFIFNCQMGKRRTTTAMVLAQLIAQQRPPPSVVTVVEPIEFKEQVVGDDSDVRQRTSSTSSSNGVDETSTSNKLNGNFAVIRELQRQLAFATQAKLWVDYVIDDCAAIFNIRSVINEFYEQSLAAAKPAKRTFYLHHALSFLERYFYLIVFGAYLLETYNNMNKPSADVATEDAADATTADESASTLQSFSTWLQQHPHLFRLLDDMGGIRYHSDKVLLDCVIKEDHFFGHARIPYTLSRNVPNFRRVGDEPIFGTAQCLEAGFHDVVGHLRSEFDRVIWVNLREEAVIYVSGKPFGFRHPDDLTENVEYPGIEADEITAIEAQVQRELTTQIQQANGLFIYFYEPALMTSEETMDHVNADTEIKTLTQIYDEVADATAFDVTYARIPVTDETAPEEKDLDDMVRLLAPVFISELGLDSRSRGDNKAAGKKPTAVVCNCQMGRGRTTTALVCTYMLRLVLQDHAAATQGDSSDTSVLQQIGATSQGDDDNGRSNARRQSAAVAGDFVVIRKLLATLDNGDACKLLVDFAVDACAHLQNLRECIAQCRDLATDRDVANAKRDHFMRRAVNYLERYFYLICFASYLLEERVRNFETTTFGQWMQTRYGSALYALLDNLCFEENVGAETHVASMRWRWRRKRKIVSRLE